MLPIEAEVLYAGDAELVGRLSWGSEDFQIRNRFEGSGAAPWPGRQEHVRYGRGLRGSSAEDCAVQEAVAELAVGIQPVGQRDEVAETGVQRAQLGGTTTEQLAPVRPGHKRFQFLFKEWQECFHCLLVLPPGEMQADSVAAVIRAKPEVVSCDGADFPDEQHRGNNWGEPSHGPNCVHCMLARYQVLALEFVAFAWIEVHAEVGQSVGPWAGNPELLGAARPGYTGQRMPCFERRLSPEKFGFQTRLSGVTRFLLQPGLAN